MARRWFKGSLDTHTANGDVDSTPDEVVAASNRSVTTRWPRAHSFRAGRRHRIGRLQGHTMKAAICARYGPPEVLELREVPDPVPRVDEILVRIQASAVTSSDWFIRSAIPHAPITTRVAMRLLVGITAPRKRILGLILAGEVEEVGSSVTRFSVGDRVYAFTKFHFGAYAQYTCLRESSTVAIAPANLSLAEAASIP